ncbi:MAG: glycosyltransferase [Lachnospiraceae bacterium]|nr:glycosyltransferase [Lachnospiraceae bacterium]
MDIPWTLRNEKIETDIICYSEPIVKDPIIEAQFKKELESKHYDLMISNDFFPSAAKVAYECQLKYAAWIYDSPYIMSMSDEAALPNCYLFHFDRYHADYVKMHRGIQIQYFHLAADCEWFGGIDIQDEEIEKYKSDVSFVGSLYDGEDCYEDLSKIMEQYHDTAALQCMQSVCINAAFQWDGRDRVMEQMTPEVVQKLNPYFNQKEMKEYYCPPDYYIANLLTQKSTFYDRTEILKLLAEQFQVDLYTTGKPDFLDQVKVHPTVEYLWEAPKVFFSSKINLNISYRSIIEGTPQRVFDIMANGGFVMSSYCKETAELFEEGKEIEFFREPEEILDKVDYYLHHEEERLRIAMNGYQKVKSEYNFSKRLHMIIDYVLTH